MSLTFNAYREMPMGSALVAAFDDDDSEVATLTASEPGVIDLDRLVMYAGINAAAPYPTLDLVLYSEVNSVLLYGSVEKVKGRNTPSVPMSQWSALRSGGSKTKLGKYRLASGDTIAITGETQGTAGSITGDFAFAAPFTPDNIRGNALPQSNIIHGQSADVLGAPINSDIAAGGAIALTVTADQDGWIYLSDLVLRSQSDAAAESEVGTWIDVLPSTTISGITLPTRDRMILGQNTPVLPGQAFCATRTYNWFDLGWLRVNAGDQLVIDGKNNGPDVANLSVSVPFWPLTGGSIKGYCPPPPCK